MSLNNYLKGGASNPKAPGKDQSWAGANAGPYLGIVKGNKDPTRMGRLSVMIPSLAQTNPNAGTESQLITCEYLSPFYGAKGVKYNIPGSTEYEHSQHSYGFWAVPPDLETTVLVIFAEGKMNQAFWIGCVQDPYTNHMTPGIASSEKTWDKTDGGPAGQLSSDVDKQQTYGSTNVPAGELNRAATGALPKNDYEAYPKPIHPLADILLKQGLSADDVRGNTSSSARRESPSQVFGISTPGRKDTGTTKQQVGAKDSGATDHVSRKTGHTFVMDDGAVDGTNQLTRLRTASGHQLLMHDTDGIVYIANGTGNAWIEMNADGRIDLYSGVGGINMRTQGDFNLHSDSNINMHAGGQIRMSSSGEFVQSAGTYMMNLGEKGIFNSSQKGSIRDYARDGLSSFTEGTQLHGATGQVHLAGQQVHFNSTKASPSWGPKWLDTGAAGITERQEGDVELTKKGIEPLQSFTKKTKTTVHRFVTHEPMPRFKAFTSEGLLPGDPRWAELAATPGTVEYMKQRLRVHPNKNIRLGQYQADAERELKIRMGTSTNPNKAREILTEIGSKYDQTYDVINQAGAAWDVAESVTNSLKNFNLSDSIKDVKANLTTQLTNQVIESISGNGAVQLFKDNVFVNSVGELFSLGGGSKAGNVLDEFGTSGNVYGTGLNDVLKNVQGITGNLNLGNLGSVANDISTVTNVYKNVLAGDITNVSQVASIASTAAGFFKTTKTGPGGSYVNPSQFSTVMKSVGTFANTAIASVGNFFKGFSDARLKEDIKLVGKSPLGINIYSFKYKQSAGTYEGVMAQEVPWAREMTDTGYYMVDYSKVDVEFRRLN